MDYRAKCLEECYMHVIVNGEEDKYSCANDISCPGVIECFGWNLAAMNDEIDRLIFSLGFNIGRKMGRDGWSGGLAENANIELGYRPYLGHIWFYMTAVSCGDKKEEVMKIKLSDFILCPNMWRLKNSILSAMEFKVNSRLESMGFRGHRSSFVGYYAWENHVGLCESEECKAMYDNHNISELTYVEIVAGRALCSECGKSRMIESVSSADKMRRAERAKEKKDKRYISKSLRFEVLDRDSYTCQACGRSAPLVELEIDHVYPWSRGGKTSIENLQALCVDCNRGKSARIQQEIAR